jgi:serine/threonine-protein kinase
MAVLGEGAFGSVYLAETVGTGLSRKVAIKVLRGDKAQMPGIVGRLRDEGRVLSLVHHRAIVRVEDLVELDGEWSVVMEYVEGCDVAELIRESPIPAKCALAIAEEVAAALHAAFNQPGPQGRPLRLVHRDIKPSNIRLTAQGEVKLLDFGVARAEFADREERTQEAAFGTVAYMAPERFQGEDTHAGDVYALGVTLFEMLCGVKPGKTAMDADRQPPGGHLADQWSWLHEANPPLHDLLAGMMAPTAGQRPTARECARALAEIRAGILGEALEDWTEQVVPEVLGRVNRTRPARDRSGSLMIERSGSQVVARAAPAPAVAARSFLAGGAAVGFAVLVAVSLVAGGLWWFSERKAEAPVPAAPATGPQAYKYDGAKPVNKTPTTKQPARPAESPRAAEVPKTQTTPAGVTRPPPPKTEPTPSATPEPAKAEPAPTTGGKGRVRLAGDAASARLTCGGASYGAGEVPEGTCDAVVQFTGGEEVTLRAVPVTAGGTTVLTCSAAFGNCKVRAE